MKIEEVQEALDYFRALIERLGNGDADNAVCVTAIEALEKQIPKEPINKQRGPYGWYGQCPGCGEDVFRVMKCTRCQPCGQALKWMEGKDSENTKTSITIPKV